MFKLNPTMKRFVISDINAHLRSWALNTNAANPHLVTLRASVTGSPDPKAAASVTAFDQAGKFHCCTGHSLEDALSKLLAEVNQAAA